MKILQSMRDAIHNETAQTAEVRKELIRVETGEQCECKKCGGIIKCEHDVVDVHELVLSSCCV